MQNKQKRFIAILSFVLIMITTFAYSALATSLSITGEANFRTVADIRVTNVNQSEAVGAVQAYDPEFTKDTITAGFTLDSSSSSMSYDVTITNSGQVDQAIYNLITQSSNNSGLSILIDGHPINETLPIIVPFGTSKTITITYSSSTPGIVNVVNKFDFRRVHYITYDLKSGQSTSTDLINGQIKYENADLKLTEDEPTLSGYDFLGWTDEQNGTTVKFNKGDTYTLDTSDKILYALYKKKGYKITFDSQDGEEPQEKIVQTGDKIGTLPTYQRDGYHFDGWYTGQTDGDKVTSDFEPTKDEIFYAHYTPYKMTINYYAGGATKNGNTTLQNQKLTTDTYDYDGEDLNINGLKNYDSQTGTWNLIKDGYHADKYWHLGNNASITKVHEDTKIAKIQDLATTLNKIDDFKIGDIEVNIYAGWTANNYTLHFDKNNVSATGVMSDQTLTYDAQEANRKINKNIFTYTGHTFVGWNTQANGQGTPYTDEQAINLVTTNNETINLYAQWIANTYTVTYNANGGTVSPSSKQVTYGSTYGTLTEPTREGYTFNGWFTDNTYTTEVTSSTQVTITDNQTIIAKWTANDYTVTFNPNGGNVTPTSKSVTYDSTYGNLPESNKTGYTFEGWNGKNLLNPTTEYAMRYDGYVARWLIDYDSTTGIYTSKTNNSHHIYGFDVTDYVEAGKTYTFSVNIVEEGTVQYVHPGFDILVNDERKVYYSNVEAIVGERIYYTLTIPTGATRIIVGINNDDKGTGVKFNDVQLEEGSTATSYEPYYVTEDTIVKQAKDHTLTAIYSANELVFNNQTSSVTYNAGSANSINIAPATNGTGSYTYSKVSESNGTSDTTYFTVSGSKINASANTPAGTYTVVVKATDNGSGVTKDATYTITVNKQKINVPSCATFTYNKATQTFLSNTDSYTVTNNTGLNAGDYTVKATPTSNYMWSDDTTTTKNIACTINPYNIGTAGNATVSPVVDRVYDAAAYEPTPSVTVPLPSSTNTYTLTTSDLTYSYTTDHTNVGEKQVTITGKGNYTGTITKTYNITKANGYITLNKTAESVEYSTTSTSFKVLTNSGALSVTSDKGTVSITGDTVTLTDISTLSVGTKVNVTVTSAATNNYKAATATYVLTITNKPLTGGSVKITGNNIVGNELTATVTDTTPAGNYTYAWYREGSSTPIATTQKYTVTSSDVGKSLRVVVTASKDNYEGTSFEDTTDATNNKTEKAKTGVTNPTTAKCINPTYNGESQVLTSTAATGYAFYDNSGIAATSYTVTAKLSDNYIWSNGDTADVTFNCSIAKKDVTVKADNQSKEYDGTALTANTSCSATGLVATHTPSCITSGTITDYAASGAVKTLSSAKIMDGTTDVSSNYNITLQNGTLTITKKAITITAKNQTVQYGSSISKTTSDVTVATLPSTDTLNSITLTQSKTAVSTDGKITASAAVIKRGTTDTTNNYTITYNQGSLTINKKNITASISSCSNKVYDGNTNASCGITLSGVQSGETATATATCKFDNKNVGTSKEITCNTFVLDGANKDNYNITTTSLTGSANITAKSITPTATASNKTYDGNANATCTISLPGIVSGDTVSSTYTGTFNNKNVGTSKAVTCSDISLTGTDKDNYSLSATSLSTTANVTAKSVAVSWTNVGPFTYNGSNQGPTATVNTGITGETMTVIATKAINKGTHTSTASCSSVTGSSACSNYTLTNTTKEFTINAQTVNPVTNLTVNTSGVVSWTASSNATGYQISIDGSTWTDMPASQTSYNYLNTIASTIGERTVYVRAINSDTTNYSTVDSGDAFAHSSNTTKKVNTYRVTVNVNNADYGTVNNISSNGYNAIEGMTYSTSGNVLTFITGASSTARTIDAVGYTTTFTGWSSSSGTITANTIITANFTRTANSYTVTANANGGSIASTTGWTGTGNTSTKSVTYDSAYGTLPTVSRTGYTLNGWYKLPNGLESIEYLDNSTGKAIDTGYYWKHENIGIHFDGTVVTNSSSQSLFGNEEYVTSSGYSRNFAGIAHGSNGSYALYIGDSTHGGSISPGMNKRFTLDINTTLSKVVSVNLNGTLTRSGKYNGSVMTHDTAYIASSSSTNVGNIFIFSNHNSSRGATNAANQNVTSMKLYAFKMYDNNVLVRDFIPAKRTSDGVQGLYDVVEKKFYTFDSNPVSYSEGMITSSSQVITASNHNIYAHWTANELTFNNKTLSEDTYGTAYTSTAFDAASNGTGSYTYTIVGGAPTGATIDSANRTISFTSSTAAGTYNVVVTATDNNSGVTKDATMKIVINKANNAITLNCASLTYNKANQNLIVSKSALGGDVYIGLESLTASNYATKGSTALTGAQATNAGSYTVYAYTPGNANYNATSTSKSCSIAKYNISSATVSTIPDHTYDNTVYKPTPSVTVPLPSSTNTYTLTDSEYDYSYSVASPKDVATYTVTMTAKADTSTFTNNYTGSVSKTYKIVQANGYVNLSATTGSVTYGTASKTFTVSSSHGGDLTVSDDNTTATSSISNGTVTIGSLGSLASGTKVKVTVTSAATTNYKEASATYELTITNAAIDCGTVAITGNNVVGEKLTASTTSTPSDVTKTYQWYTNTSDSVTGGTAISGATSNEFTLTSSQVGKYIYATITCSKTNYTTSSSSGKATTTSNKTATTKTKVAKPTVADYCANPTYNGSAQTITNTAADGYAFSNNSATNYSSTGYNVTASLSTNYIWSDYTTANTTINCNITRRPVTYKADDQSKTYDGSALSANTNCTLTSGTLVSGHSATCATSGSQTNAGSSTKTLSSVTIKNGTTDVTANYNITKTNGTLTVNKANATCTINSTPTITYPGATTGNITYSCTGDGALSVTSSDTSVITVGTVGTTSTPLTAKKIGSSTISVSRAAGTNYNAATAKTSTINVTGTIYSITLDNQSATSAGTAKAYYSYNTTKTVNGTLCYYYTDSALTTCLTSGYYITKPTKTGYTFGGYYTSTGGSGTQYVNDSGSFVNNVYQKYPSQINSSYTTDITLYAKWTANTYAITYDYNTTNYTFASNAYIDTKYTIDWDKNFKLNQTVNFSTLGQRYLFFGNYNAANNLNLELSSNKLRVWSGSDKALSTATLAANTDIATEFNYTASSKAFTYTSTGTNSNATANATNDKTGLSGSTLRIGTDSRTNGTFKPYTVKAASITDYYTYGTKLTNLPSSPTKPGYSFGGWYTAATGGTAVTTSTDVPASNTTYYARWSANALTFNDQTLNAGTYGTAYTSNAFDAASNGTGSYTYSKISETKSGSNTSYFTVSGTSITAAATTPAGTYSVGVRATDNNSGVTKDATMSITINQKAITLTAGSSSRAYNGSALTNSTCTVTSGSLVSGHSVSCTMTSASTITTPGSVANTINTNTVKDSSNNDVTSNYSITKVAGTLTITNASFSGGSVSISGNNIVGSTLTATITAPTPTPDSYTYQWYRGDTAISGANSSTYSLVAADLNNIIKVKVTAKKTYYNDYSPSGFTVATTAASNGTQKTAYKYTATTKKNVSSATGSDTSVSCYAYASTGGCNVTLPANPYTLTGWTFNGWVNAGTGTTTTTTSGTAASGTMNITSNVNIVATWYKSYSATFTLQDSNAATASANSASCTAYNGAASCTISTTPTLTAKSGYTVVGWGTSTSSTSAASSFTSGNTYYSVTYNSTALSGTFTVQDTNAATKSGGSTSCYRYNGSNSCTITAPKLTANTNYSVVGWKKDGTTASTTSDLAATGSATVSITANVTYKSVTSRTLTAYPQKNLSSATGTPSNVTCTAYNGQSCNVTTPAANAYSLSNWSIIGWKKTGNTTTTTSTATSGDAGANSSLSISDNTNIVAIWRNSNYNTQYTATYWYNNNSNSGSISLTSTQKSCNIAAVYNGATIPTTCAPEVPGRSSVGKYNASYYGYATSLSSMTATIGSNESTHSISADTTFYAIYSSALTIYYQNSSAAIASSSSALYRNEYITNVTSGSQAMGTLTSNGRNTTQATTVSLSNIRGTFVGLNSTANSTTSYGVNTTTIINTNTTTFYAISTYTSSVTATFYYSKDTSGTVASVQASGNQNRYAYCASSSAVSNTLASNVAISPTLSPAEVAPTGTAALGWSSATDWTSTTSVTTANQAYYRVYRQALTIYYPTGTSSSNIASKNNVIYRHAYMATSSATTFTRTITNGTGGTTVQLRNVDVTSSLLSNMYGTFTGLATSANTKTKYDINNASNVVNKDTTTYYAVNTYTTDVTATFYYSKAAAGTVASVTKAGTQTRNIYCTSTSAITTDVNSNGAISPSLSPAEVVPTGTAAVGWATASSSATTTSATTANTTYYRVYKQALTIYYPTSTSAVTSKNNVIYRNAFLTTASPTVGTTKFTTRVVNGVNGTTQLTNANVTSSVLASMYGTFTGLATSANTTTKYDINNAANVINNATTTYYAVNTYTTDVSAEFYYSNSSNAAVTTSGGSSTSTRASGTRTYNVYCSSTSEATTSLNSNGSINPTITGEVAPHGTTAIGWATSSKSMTTTSPTTETVFYYRIYRSNITNYYWNGSSYTTRTIYRNCYYNSYVGNYRGYICNLSTSNTGTTDLTPETGQNSKAWNGYATSNGGGIVYTSVSDAASSSATTLYSVYQLDAVDVYYDNTLTGMTCETVQCALDSISRMLNRTGAKSGGNNYLCKIMPASGLHTATISGSTVTFGRVASSYGVVGNTYICDVNGDKTYNATNEVFYYVNSPYPEYATLISANSVSAGSPSNTAMFAYDSTNNNWYGPRTAIAQLPETTLWKDVGLYKNTRTILAFDHSFASGRSTTGGTTPTYFSYKGYSGRFLSLGEIRANCSATETVGSLENCKFLLENTYYQNTSFAYGWWLENPDSSNNNQIWRVGGQNRYVRSNSDSNASNSTMYAVRPAIEVRKCDIEGSGATSCD